MAGAVLKEAKVFGVTYKNGTITGDEEQPHEGFLGKWQAEHATAPRPSVGTPNGTRTWSKR